MSAHKKANTAVILGFITALFGLFQVMWTTPPWWRKDGDSVATVSSARPLPIRPVEDPTSGDVEDVHVEMAQSTPREAPWQWGYYLIGLGAIAAVLALGYRLIDRLSHVDVGDGPFHPVL